MSEDKKIAIIKELRGKPNYNDVIYKRVSKAMSRQTFFTLRDQLIMAGKIMRKEWGRRVILYLPEDEESMKEFMKEQVARKHITLVGEDFKYESRKKHTEDLKKEVIEPWLEQLWSINGLLISCPKGGFFVEDAALFSDFKNHIKFNPNPFNELESYRKKYEEFSDKKSRIYQSEITRMIGEEMEKIPVDFGKKDTTTYDLAIWIFGEICDSFDLRLYYSKDFDEREAIGHMKLDFDSYVKDADGLYEYFLIFYIGDSRLQLCCGSIAKWKKSKEEFKREMDEFIKIILKRVKESEHIKDTIIALHETRKELFYHLQNMRESLKKHYELQILPGDCRYYPWVE